MLSCSYPSTPLGDSKYQDVRDEPNVSVLDVLKVVDKSFTILPVLRNPRRWGALHDVHCTPPRGGCQQLFSSGLFFFPDKMPEQTLHAIYALAAESKSVYGSFPI